MCVSVCVTCSDMHGPLDVVLCVASSGTFPENCT